jgi:mediator of RNA polymerase II transcription subunit 14
VSITCQDQLSSGGNFDLQFSRCQDKGDVRFNPHDNAEPFFRNILRNPHGRLAQSVHQLVKTLRSTLPVVSVLEEIKSQHRPEDVKSLAVDTIAKGAGWYRLMYGDFRSVVTAPWTALLISF